MEGGNRRRRQDDPPDYPRGVSGASQQASSQQSSGGSSRPSQMFASRQNPPTASAVREEQAEYGYYGGASQFANPPVPAGSMQYPQGYPQDQQREQDFPHYRSNVLFDLQQQSTQSESYGALETQYQQPRQATAVEVLSSQFAGATPFFMPGTGEQNIAGPSQQAGSQYSPLSYGPQNPVVRPSVTPSYQAGLGDSAQATVAHSSLTEQQFGQGQGQGSSSYDDAYEQYQIALRRTFENTRNGQLVEAGQSLLEISEWLLSHAVELGLVVDNQDLHSDRIKLWNEFNRCWLSALQRQKEMTQGMLDTGQPPPLPQSLIQEDFLERMGSQLVRLCDNMERHGLVDYQMGVWEEEIISMLQECLDLLETNDEKVSSESKARLGLSGGPGRGPGPGPSLGPISRRAV